MHNLEEACNRQEVLKGAAWTKALSWECAAQVPEPTAWGRKNREVQDKIRDNREAFLAIMMPLAFTRGDTKP